MPYHGTRPKCIKCQGRLIKGQYVNQGRQKWIQCSRGGEHQIETMEAANDRVEPM